MKKVISLFLSLIMLLSVTAGIDFSAFAMPNSGQCGENVSYTFDEATGTLTISGKGEMANYNSNNYYHPVKSPFRGNENITTVKIKNGVTTIGSYAFYECKGIKKVIIPSSITEINYNPFGKCTALQEFKVSTKNEKYSSSKGGVLYSKHRTSLILYPYGRTNVEYSIFNSVIKIDARAFYYCKKLKVLTIPESVTKIINTAFGDKNSIETINYKGKLSEWKNVKIYTYERPGDGDYSGDVGDEVYTVENQGNHLFDLIKVFCGDKRVAVGIHSCRAKDIETVNEATFDTEGKERFYCVCDKCQKAAKGKEDGQYIEITIPKLSSPKLLSVNKGKKSFVVNWLWTTRVDGYQIQYSTKKSMKNAKKIKIEGTKKTKRTVKKLKGKKKYYVRIRAYKKNNGKTKYSKWSKAKTVTTKK